MPTTLQSKYGSNNQSITITATSLGNGNSRQSAAIDNTSNLFEDVLVFVKLKSGASSVSATGYCNIYAYGTADGGATYSDSASGSDAAITLTSPPNMRLIGVVNMVANAITYPGGPFSVAAAFGGRLPDHWGIVIENKTGAALDASVASAWYQGVEGQAA